MSSWLFGDGAQLVNAHAAAANLTARIVPLDAVLGRALADRRSGGGFGFRVARDLTPRVAAEFSFDHASTPFAISRRAELGVETSAASFRHAHEAGFLFVPATGRTFTASATIQDGGGSQSIATGAVRITLARGRVAPYATVGVGIASYRGEPPAAALEGSYAFNYLGIFPFRETDSVAIRQTSDDRSLVGVIGGGLNGYLTQRSGIRLDVRVHVGKATDRVLLDATPTVTPGTPTIQIFVQNTPALTFTNAAQPAIPTNLSGPAVDDFVTFESSGLRRTVQLSVGYFFRF